MPPSTRKVLSAMEVASENPPTPEPLVHVVLQTSASTGTAMPKLQVSEGYTREKRSIRVGTYWDADEYDEPIPFSESTVVHVMTPSIPMSLLGDASEGNI